VTTWVIGGSSGIGAATTELLRKDLRSYLQTSIDEVDVTHPHDIRRYWNTHLDITDVVYSAGVNALMWNSDFMVAWARKIFDVNVYGLMQLVAAIEESGREANVVVVTSDAATRPMRTSMAYCASKAAMNAIVKQAAREGAPDFRINAVAPGMIDGTQMTKYIDMTVPKLRNWTPEEALRYETSQIPMGRRGTPEEVAEVILAVLDGPNYQTGAIVEVNGGR
jgi:NAD(P)-dependent dehydrogenase (short-subunit alcohol dehydrogenase family)